VGGGIRPEELERSRRVEVEWIRGGRDSKSEPRSGLWTAVGNSLSDYDRHPQERDLDQC
jgi:hypothetical protein